MGEILFKPEDFATRAALRAAVNQKINDTTTFVLVFNDEDLIDLDLARPEGEDTPAEGRDTPEEGGEKTQ